VEKGEFNASPLIPDWWDYFSVENLWLNGNKYRIIYDKYGSHYGIGTGLFIKNVNKKD
jgi:hypothetical protein